MIKLVVPKDAVHSVVGWFVESSSHHVQLNRIMDVSMQVVHKRTTQVLLQILNAGIPESGKKDDIIKKSPCQSPMLMVNLKGLKLRRV